MDQGGPKKSKKMPSSRYQYDDLISQANKQKKQGLQLSGTGAIHPPPIAL